MPSLSCQKIIDPRTSHNRYPFPSTQQRPGVLYQKMPDLDRRAIQPAKNLCMYGLSERKFICKKNRSTNSAHIFEKVINLPVTPTAPLNSPSDYVGGRFSGKGPGLRPGLPSNRQFWVQVTRGKQRKRPWFSPKPQYSATR